MDKGSYQVKHLSIEHHQVSQAKLIGRQKRPSWICSNNEDDLLFNLNIHQSSLEDDDSLSSDEIDTPNSNENSPVEIIMDVVEILVKSTSKTTNENLKETIEVAAEHLMDNSNNNSNSNSNNTEFSSSPPVHNVYQVRNRLPLNKSCFSLMENTNEVKLDCDMDNSLRRQSISARFRTAQQQQKEEKEFLQNNHQQQNQIGEEDSTKSFFELQKLNDFSQLLINDEFKVIIYE